jgi:glycosyltransferase involved in cell wall biosynthesis
VERFLEEAELDAWTAAADALILPYRRSWSSGALARAQSLGTPAIVTAVGGLPEQASDRDVVVGSDRELDQALLRVGERGSVRG